MDEAYPDPGEPIVLTVPGLNNSGLAHWQTVWERERINCERVDLGSWSRPRRMTWVTRLNRAIADQRRSVILCAHSLGCMAVAWWAALEGVVDSTRVAGALLVAPPDCERRDHAALLGEFGPTPRKLLPFPSIVVASRDDPWAAHDWSRATAQFWGSRFVDAGGQGHLNAESGLGPWAFGQGLLDRLVARAA